MANEYWVRQQPDEPLFADLAWSRPENKRHAGKILIAGGNKYGFAAPAEAYNESIKAGVGTARVLLPDCLQKTVGKLFPAAEFAPSTPSGSFAKSGLAELLDLAAWSDGVILAGGIGHNSETAILIEQLTEEYSGQITVVDDAIEYSQSAPEAFLGRAETTLVLTIPQLQKLATAAKFTKAITSNIGFLQLVDLLHEFTSLHSAKIVTHHTDNLFVAASGQISTTKSDNVPPNQLIKTAARAAVWWLQNPAKPFEALTTSVSRID